MRWIPKGRDPNYESEHEVESYESYGNEPNYAIHVQHKHTAADTTTGPEEEIYPGVVTSEETEGAQMGQAGASRGYQQIEDFTPSVGMHSVGADHADSFSDALQYAGGVRQGHMFVSDPAPGAARVGGNPAFGGNDGNHAYEDIDVQTDGSGETFEERQHSRWAGNGG